MVRPKVRPRITTETGEGPIAKITLFIAILGVFAMGIVVWRIGAGWTLDFLRDEWPQVAALGYWIWAIPVMVSAIEFVLWPRVGSVFTRWVVYGVVLAFDVGTSSGGFVVWAKGRTFSSLGGVTLPENALPLWGAGIVLGLGLAYGPEKLARYAWSELRTLFGR